MTLSIARRTLTTLLLGATLGLGATAASAKVVADSVADFDASTQGAGHWFYGWSAGAIDAYTPRGFELMTQSDDTGWYVAPGVSWTQLHGRWAHPQGTTTSGGRTPTLQVAVRRWVSPAEGVYKIAGTVRHYGGAESDGVAVRIVKGAKLLWAADIGALGSQDYQVKARLKAGQAIDFLLGPGAAGNDISDSTEFTAVIRSAR